MKERVSRELNEFGLLLRVVPATSLTCFVISVFLMNILANKELLSLPYLSLDCGITLSWLSFLTMDMLVKRFGPKASIELSIFAEFLNLCFSGLLYLISLIPQNWGEFYATENAIVNEALNNTIGGTWYIVIGSTTAFIVSAIINALLNHRIGKNLKEDNFQNYSLRSYVSTFVGQFADNLIFAYIVSINFFGWTHAQCWMCALTGACVELLCEVIFTPFGYKISKKWDKDGIGAEYLYVRAVTQKG